MTQTTPITSRQHELIMVALHNQMVLLKDEMREIVEAPIIVGDKLESVSRIYNEYVVLYNHLRGMHKCVNR